MAFQLTSGETFDFFGAPSKPAAPAPAPAPAGVAGANGNAAAADGWQTVTRGKGDRRRVSRGTGKGGKATDDGMLIDDEPGPSRRGGGRERRDKAFPYSRADRHGGKGKHRADSEPDSRAPVGTPNAPATISIKGKATSSPAKAAARDSSARGKQTSAIATLRKVLASRYNADSKLMDLSNLRADPIMKEAGFDPPGVKGAPTNTAGAMWKLCRTSYPNIQSISLAENNLRRLTALSPALLATELPGLTALSLAGNSFADFSDLNPLSPVIGGVATVHGGTKPGLTQLREIILTGTPLRTQAEVKGPEGMQEYIVELVRRFPSLALVDSIAIDPNLRLNLPPPPTSRSNAVSKAAGLPARPDKSAPLPPEPRLPLAVKGSLFGDSLAANIASTFCAKFFAAYDTDRQSLVDVYAPDATFSFEIMMGTPMRAKAAKLHVNHPALPAQEGLNWAPYKDLRRSRNLKHVTIEHHRATNLMYGPGAIVELAKSLPATRHPIADPDSDRNFVVDAMQVPNLLGSGQSAAGGVGGSQDGSVLMVSVHGQFKELPATGVRSFDRTFLLGAAGTATAASLKGWPCIVLSDMLTVRGYSSPNAWTGAPSPVSNAPAGAEIGPDQKAMLEQLSAATKLAPAAALDCLRSNGWDPARAMANFQELQAKGQLPPEAFLS